MIAYDDDPSTRAPERMARQVDWIREAAGERFERIELSTMVSPVVAGDAIETRRREVAADRRRLAIPPEPRSVGAGTPRPGTGAASWPADDPPRRRL